MYQKYELEIRQRKSEHEEYDKLANIVGRFKLIWIVMLGYKIGRAHV